MGGSFKEYLRDMSCGQHMVESVFPQTNSNDGTVYYLTMDKTVDEYKGSVQEIQLIKEIANQLNTKYPNLDGKMIDKDNDGVVDNLMIIASVQSHGHFVSHATNAGNDTKLAGKGIGLYNLIETTFSDTSGYYGFNIHTAAHEYIHSEYRIITVKVMYLRRVTHRLEYGIRCVFREEDLGLWQ